MWDYIKPTLKKDEVRRELHEPSAPVVQDFSTTLDATIQSLTAQQLQRYKMAYKVYKRDVSGQAILAGNL